MSPSSETTVSKAEYARRRGCAPSAITRAIKEGRISAVDGRINPVLADGEWSANSRARGDSRPAAAPVEQPAAEAQAPAVAPAPSPPPLNDYNSARVRREHADAERSELATAQMAGRLVDREAALKGVFDAFRQLRDGAFSAVKTQARAVVGLTDLREIEIALEDELRSVFASWEEHLRSRIGGSS